MAENNDPLQVLVERLQRWRLASAAALLLEAHRPLLFVTQQALLAAQPLLMPWQDGLPSFMAGLGIWLGEHPDEMDQLLVRLEADQDEKGGNDEPAA